MFQHPLHVILIIIILGQIDEDIFNFLGYSKM